MFKNLVFVYSIFLTFLIWKFLHPRFLLIFEVFLKMPNHVLCLDCAFVLKALYRFLK